MSIFNRGPGDLSLLVIFIILPFLSSCGVSEPEVPLRPAFSIGCTAIVDSVLTVSDRTTGGAAYRWEFSDGRRFDGISASVSFSDTGSYRVTMYCRSDNGREDSLSKEFRVFPPIPDAKSLDIPKVVAPTSRFGWVTVVEMVLEYYGVDVDRCAILSDQLYQGCCDKPEDCKQLGGIDQIEIALIRFGNMEPERRYAALSEQDIRMEIAQDRPVIAYMIDQASVYIGHAFIIYGYDNQGLFLIHDPVLGSNLYDYEELLIEDGPPLRFDWGVSLYCMRPE